MFEMRIHYIFLVILIKLVKYDAKETSFFYLMGFQSTETFYAWNRQLSTVIKNLEIADTIQSTTDVNINFST